MAAMVSGVVVDAAIVQFHQRGFLAEWIGKELADLPSGPAIVAEDGRNRRFRRRASGRTGAPWHGGDRWRDDQASLVFPMPKGNARFAGVGMHEVGSRLVGFLSATHLRADLRQFRHLRTRLDNDFFRRPRPTVVLAKNRSIAAVPHPEGQNVSGVVINDQIAVQDSDVDILDLSPSLSGVFATPEFSSVATYGQQCPIDRNCQVRFADRASLSLRTRLACQRLVGPERASANPRLACSPQFAVPARANRLWYKRRRSPS